MLEPARLAEIVAACGRHKVWFISDEIYHGLTYAFPAETALKHSDNVIVINSFSKYFSMTGWRIGWMVVPDGLVRTIERLAQNLYISPPAVSQVAAIGAFDGIDELESNRRAYAANRALLLEELPKAGFTSIAPADGAFYLYCDVSRDHRRQRRLRQGHAGRDGSRRNAGPRLRCRARPPLHPLLLFGHHGRHGRRGGAAHGLAQAVALARTTNLARTWIEQATRRNHREVLPLRLIDT